VNAAVKRGDMRVMVEYIGPDERRWAFSTCGPRPDPRSDDFGERVGEIVRDAVMAMLRAEREDSRKVRP
jgi:hypothetical protein